MVVSLEQYISEEIRKPFDYATRCDCAGTIDRWIELNRGYSIFEKFNIKYEDFEQKEEVLEFYKDFLKAILKVARQNQEVSTKYPEKGDVAAIIFSLDKIGLAIHCGDFWFTRDKNGTIGVPLNDVKIIKAWKLNKDG